MSEKFFKWSCWIRTLQVFPKAGTVILIAAYYSFWHLSITPRLVKLQAQCLQLSVTLQILSPGSAQLAGAMNVQDCMTLCAQSCSVCCLRGQKGPINHTVTDRSHWDFNVKSDHISYWGSSLCYTARLSVLTVQAGSHHTVYKPPSDEVLISAEFFLPLWRKWAGLGNHRQSLEWTRNLRTSMLLCTIFKLGMRWRGEGNTILLAVDQKMKKKLLKSEPLSAR